MKWMLTSKKDANCTYVRMCDMVKHIFCIIFILFYVYIHNHPSIYSHPVFLLSIIFPISNHYDDEGAKTWLFLFPLNTHTHIHPSCISFVFLFTKSLITRTTTSTLAEKKKIPIHIFNIWREWKTGEKWKIYGRRTGKKNCVRRIWFLVRQEQKYTYEFTYSNRSRGDTTHTYQKKRHTHSRAYKSNRSENIHRKFFLIFLHFSAFYVLKIGNCTVYVRVVHIFYGACWKTEKENQPTKIYKKTKKKITP